MVNKFLPAVVESCHSTPEKHVRICSETLRKQWHGKPLPRGSATGRQVRFFAGTFYRDEDSCAMESSVSALMPELDDEPVRIDSAGDVEEVVLFSMSYIAENRCSS